MFSLHMMVEATREDELNLARMGLKHSESNMADADLNPRKVPTRLKSKVFSLERLWTFILVPFSSKKE